MYFVFHFGLDTLFDENQTQKLLVTRAQTLDSGAYTCNPSRGRPVVADVHIITGAINYILCINYLNYIFRSIKQFLI